MLNDANATVKSCCNDHAYVDMEEGSVTYGEVTGCTLTKDKNGVDCEFGLDPLCAVIECKCAVEINENNEIVVSTKSTVDFDFCSFSLFQTCFIVIVTYTPLYLKHPNKSFFNVNKYILTSFTTLYYCITLLHYYKKHFCQFNVKKKTHFCSMLKN